MPDKPPIPFRGFDERGDVRIYYHGILPHWRQPDCTYFVTFRLDDALPAAVIRELEHERRQWLKHRGTDVDSRTWTTKFKQLPPEDKRAYERFAATRLHQQLDQGYGSCVLRKKEPATIVADALNYFHGQRVLTGDFVIMPNHVHALMRPLQEYELEDLLHSIKSYTSNEINRLQQTTGPLWMKESYDHIVRDFEQLEAFQHYIKANPGKAGLNESEYIYQSARYTPESGGGF